MDFKALTNASLGDELNPLAYNPDEYPDMDTMLRFIEEQGNKPANTPKIEKLAKSGRIKAESMETYLADRSDSSSALKEVLKTPAHYRFYLDEKANFEVKKKCFEMGTFSHSAILEPVKFEKIKVEPKHSLASNDGVSNLILFYEQLNKCTGIDFSGYKLDEKKTYLQSLKEKCEYEMIEEEYDQKIRVMDKNSKAYGNGIIAKILKGAFIEHSFYGTDPTTGKKVKIRPDAINFEENIGVNAIISVKTTSAQSLEAFYRDAAKLMYDMSEAMYLDVASNITGRKFNTVITIMLQTVAPFLPAVLWWNPEDLLAGKHKYLTALKKVQRCETLGMWPGFEDEVGMFTSGIIDMQLPEWSKKIIQPVDIDN